VRFLRKASLSPYHTKNQHAQKSPAKRHRLAHPTLPNDTIKTMLNVMNMVKPTALVKTMRCSIRPLKAVSKHKLRSRTWIHRSALNLLEICAGLSDRISHKVSMRVCVPRSWVGGSISWLCWSVLGAKSLGAHHYPRSELFTYLIVLDQLVF
jgi:hypothetical protein